MKHWIFHWEVATESLTIEHTCGLFVFFLSQTVKLIQLRTFRRTIMQKELNWRFQFWPPRHVRTVWVWWVQHWNLRQPGARGITNRKCHQYMCKMEQFWREYKCGNCCDKMTTADDTRKPLQCAENRVCSEVCWWLHNEISTAVDCRRARSGRAPMPVALRPVTSAPVAGLTAP